MNFIKLLDKIAGAAMISIAVLLVVNIISRRFFNAPIGVVYEAVCMITVIMGSLSQPNCAEQDGYISMSLLFDRLSLKAQKITEGLMLLAVIIMMGLTSLELARYAGTIRAHGEVLAFSKWPFYPFIYLISICFFLLMFVFIAKFVYKVRENRLMCTTGEELEAKR